MKISDDAFYMQGLVLQQQADLIENKAVKAAEEMNKLNPII